MKTLNASTYLFFCFLFGAALFVYGESNGQSQQQQELEKSSSSMPVLLDEGRWYNRFLPVRQLYQNMQGNSKEIADQRYHPVPTLESQLSPAMLRFLMLNQNSRVNSLTNPLTANNKDKRNPEAADIARTAALAATVHRKIRAEGENMANMLGMLKKMEECMKMTEGLRFRRSADYEEGDLMKAAGKRSDSSHRIRALKSLCQM